MTPLACLCVAGIAGCGSSDDPGTIPPENSSQLITLLDAVSNDVATGDCELAAEHADEFTDNVNLLPAEVDDDVKSGLQDAAARLEDLSADPEQCEDTTGASGVDGPETTEPEPEPTETTEQTTTETQPEEEDQGDGEDEPQTEQPPPSDEGNAGGGPGTDTGEGAVNPPPTGGEQPDETGGITPGERPQR